MNVQFTSLISSKMAAFVNAIEMDYYVLYRDTSFENNA